MVVCTQNSRIIQKYTTFYIFEKYTNRYNTFKNRERWGSFGQLWGILTGVFDSLKRY
jgi:hypothetical protein